MATRDEVVERVAQKLKLCAFGEIVCEKPWSVYAKAALSALQPGDEIAEFLWATDANPWALEAKIARKAATEMRERCAKYLKTWLHSDSSFDSPADLELIANCIRALPLPGETSKED